MLQPRGCQPVWRWGVDSALSVVDRRGHWTGRNVKRFTESVRLALSARNWYAALAVALTLPDICAAAEDPGTGKSRQRYTAWWGRCMEPRYTASNGDIWLTALDAYLLRCSYLHSGTDELEGKGRVLERVQFREPYGNGSLHMQRVDNVLVLEVDRFCLEVCEGVEGWLNLIPNQPAVMARLSGLLALQGGRDSIPGAVRIGPMDERGRPM